MTVRRMIGWTLLALLAVLVLAVGLASWRLLAPISTPPFRRDDGKVLAGSIAVIERWPVGGVEQSVIIRGRDRANPVLLFVHGGPGSSETVALRRFNAALEDDFVVVYWDQRYAGQSYDAKLPVPREQTIQQYVDDLGVVVDRLRARFGRQRVGILAHSWGTVPGILYAEDNPGKLYAYVGVGQVANVPESEKRSYAWVLREAKARRADKAVAELERLGPPPRPGSIFTPREWIMAFGGSFHGDMTNTSLIAQSLGQSEANGRDLVAFGKSGQYSETLLHGEFTRFVIDDAPRAYGVPIFLLSGRYDRQSEASVARGFFDRITAPRKAFVWFEQSAHSPMFEEPRAYTDWISGTVAPLGERGRPTPPAS
jgi:proline iminopeptidase